MKGDTENQDPGEQHSGGQDPEQRAYGYGDERLEEELEQTIAGWLDVLDDLTYYELLSVDENATPQELQAAFHQFAQSFHPDRHRHRSPDQRQGITRIFRKATEAYRVLGDGRRRSTYNLDLARLRGRLSGAPPSEIPRSLEDLCSTPGGRLHGRQAERALSEGELEKAVALIGRALVAEGPSPQLEARKRAVSDAIELARRHPHAPEVVIPDAAGLPRGIEQLLAGAPGRPGGTVPSPGLGRADHLSPEASAPPTSEAADELGSPPREPFGE